MVQGEKECENIQCKAVGLRAARDLPPSASQSPARGSQPRKPLSRRDTSVEVKKCQQGSQVLVGVEDPTANEKSTAFCPKRGDPKIAGQTTGRSTRPFILA